MAKPPTSPLKITAHLQDGRLNSADGVVMFDSILYHAWFWKHCPEVLEGIGSTEYNGYIGLPLRQLPGNRWAASRGVYEETGRTVEYLNKRPNFFNADKMEHLSMERGIISDSVGLYRAYRMPNVIRTIKNCIITFYAVGHADKIRELLENMSAVGKKAAAGYGIVEHWAVEDCEADYTLWHPEYGLMRPVEVGEENGLDLDGYPIYRYGVKPPYWKPKNARLCYVPVGDAKNSCKQSENSCKQRQELKAQITKRYDHNSMSFDGEIDFSDEIEAALLPDSASIGEIITCRKCGFEWRTIGSARCPKCGGIP